MAQVVLADGLTEVAEDNVGEESVVAVAAAAAEEDVGRFDVTMDDPDPVPRVAGVDTGDGEGVLDAVLQVGEGVAQLLKDAPDGGFADGAGASAAPMG